MKKQLKAAQIGGFMVAVIMIVIACVALLSTVIGVDVIRDL
jgi:hypothetical protein